MTKKKTRTKTNIKIIVKKAISRKPYHIYYFDRWGNIIEEPMNNINNLLTFKDKIKFKYIDFKRLFK